MNGLCTGVGWYDGRLSFELRDNASSKHLTDISVGADAGFEIVGSRRCIGFRSPEASSLTPCPENAANLSAAQCANCFESTRILPCLRCTGDRCNNPARRQSCVAPDNHAVYLASFGPGVIKVGVARWERRFERLAEQGARAAIIVARDDGQQVRRVESQFRFANIADRLSPTDKLNAYTRPGSQASLRAELLEAFAMTKLRVVGQWLKEPELVTMPDLPELKTPPRLLRPKPGFRTRGKVFAICGQALIVDSDVGERVALEAGSLIGYELRELAAHEQGEGQLTMQFA